MNRTQKRLLWGAALMVALLVLLGAGARSIGTPTPELQAQLWVEDLGEPQTSEYGYSEEYGTVIWRVKGSDTTVIMDENYDLLGVEFH